MTRKLCEEHGGDATPLACVRCRADRTYLATQAVSSGSHHPMCEAHPRYSTFPFCPDCRIADEAGVSARQEAVTQKATLADAVHPAVFPSADKLRAQYAGAQVGTKPEAVNHPKHYNAHPSGIECIDVVEHMCFNLGNAMKYIWRADEKGAAVEDLKKAAWYIQREIEKRSK